MIAAASWRGRNWPCSRCSPARWFHEVVDEIAKRCAACRDYFQVAFGKRFNSARRRLIEGEDLAVERLERIVVGLKARRLGSRGTVAQR